MTILQQEIRDMKARYRREQELMLSITHNNGMKNVRQHLRAPLRTEKTSFLGIQRNKVRLCSSLFLLHRALLNLFRIFMLSKLRLEAVATSIYLLRCILTRTIIGIDHILHSYYDRCN